MKYSDALPRRYPATVNATTASTNRVNERPEPVDVTVTFAGARDGKSIDPSTGHESDASLPLRAVMRGYSLQVVRALNRV